MTKRITGGPRSRRLFAYIGVLAALAVAAAAVVLLPAPPTAQACETSKSWRWGADPSGSTCKISAIMPDHPTGDSVVLSGIFNGCDEGRPVGTGDSLLEVDGDKGPVEGVTDNYRGEVCHASRRHP